MGAKKDDFNLRDEYTPRHSQYREKNNQNKAMMNITINYPILYENQIQDLIMKGIVPSRSEAIRIAVREFLYKELKFVKRLRE